MMQRFSLALKNKSQQFVHRSIQMHASYQQMQ
jgi:hypothetical protein